MEHDISILTGLHAAQHTQNFRVHCVYLTRDNQMLTGAALSNIDLHISGKIKGKPCRFSDGNLYIKNHAVKIDGVLNCCHGGIGENGELAAYLEIAGVPVTSCGYVAAADAQSKTRTRQILSAAGLPQPLYKSAAASDDLVKIIEELKFEFPVIVKPDTLGSSIGISIARNENELKEALSLAFSLDKNAIIEEFFADIREINCSAMRISDEIKVSKCEEIKNKSEFFGFSDKYLNPSSGFIKKGKTNRKNLKTAEDAQNEKIFNEIQRLAEQVYKIFNASGLIRVDFMLAGEKIYVNEINTVPGFLSYHLWAKSGIPYGVVINALIRQAVKDAESDANRKQTEFKSDILQKNRGLLS